jgi:hypothetical protein
VRRVLDALHVKTRSDGGDGSDADIASVNPEILFAGGSALNVITNQHLRSSFANDFRVFTPPSPGRCN